MPLTDELISFHIRLIPGQDTKRRDTLLEETNVEQAENLRYDTEVGSVVKRPRLAYYNSTSLGANPVTSIYRYYAGTDKFLLAAHGSTMKVGDDSAGTFSNIKTGLTSSKKFSFVTYKGLSIYGNGYDNTMQTDGVAAWELGACKAALTAGGANLDASAAYYYAVTLDNNAVISGAVTNTVTTGAAGGSRKVTLSNIPLGPAGTVDRKIFRTEGGGSTLKLLTTLSDNSTVTYVDDIADGSLGATMGAVTDAVPKGAYLNLYRERLLITGDPNLPNRIHYSNAFLPHYILKDTNDDFVDISPDDGDVITGIPILLGTVCVFKRNNIRKWHIDSADVDQWFVDDPISYQGSPAPWSITQSPYGIIYMGWDHLYNFDGSVSRPIVDAFDTNEISAGTLTNCVGFWHTNIYLLSYINASGGTDYANRVMRYEWLRNAVSIDTITLASFTSFKGDDEAGELYYGDSQNGYVYLAENYLAEVVLNTITGINGDLSYPSSIYSGLDDIGLSGTEQSPIISNGWTVKIDDAAGDIDTGYGGTAVVDRRDTSGTYTSEVFLINAGAMGKIYWNESLDESGDIQFYTRSGATIAATEAAGWSAALTTPGGSTIVSAANVYFQFKVDFTSGVITTTPTISTSGGFAIKFTYEPGVSFVSGNVPFIFGTGYRNFGRPAADKILKKIILIYSGTGSFTVTWTTDYGYTGSWTINMTTNPIMYEAFFPDDAFGRKVKFTVTKDDTDDFTLKELMGLWTSLPVLI